MKSRSTFLITGGTGSFGQKFVEIILKKYNPKKIIIFSRDEQKQNNMNLRLGNKQNNWFTFSNSITYQIKTEKITKKKIQELYEWCREGKFKYNYIGKINYTQKLSPNNK